jgi:hypothetical protein
MPEPEDRPTSRRSEATIGVPRRVWAVALVTFRQAMRMWLWMLGPLAVVVIVLADVSAPRFDPVFDAVPGALGTTLLVMAAVVSLVAVLFGTYSLPAEVYSRVAYTVTTKPVRRWEIILGKIAGMGLLLAVLLALIGAGAYGYIRVRAAHVRGLARARLDEASERTPHDADLNALRGLLRVGPMQVHRYVEAEEEPRVRIEWPSAQEAPAGLTWALAADGMRLVWDLGELPVADWLADEPGVLALNLALRPPPGAPPRQAIVAVRIVPELSPEQWRQIRRDEFNQRFTAHRRLSESGVVQVPLAASGAEPPPGGLPLPGRTPFRVEVSLLARRDELSGYVLGAGGRSLRVVRPDGARLAAPAPPRTVTQGTRGRLWIAGRSAPPRQVAVFRLEDVPARSLGPGPAVVEFAAPLDAMSPATVETVAEVTFVDPETGRRQDAVRFTPEPHRASVLHVDPEVWRGDGPLEVRVACLTEGDLIGVNADSVRLRLDAGPFTWNLAKAAVGLWLFGMVTASAGVAVSARLSWFVAMFAAIGFFVVAVVKASVLQTLFGLPGFAGAVRGLERLLERVWEGADALTVLRLFPLPVPDVMELLPPDSVRQGAALSASLLGWQVLYAGVWIALAFALGALFYRRREIAA